MNPAYYKYTIIRPVLYKTLEEFLPEVACDDAIYHGVRWWSDEVEMLRKLKDKNQIIFDSFDMCLAYERVKDGYKYYFYDETDKYKA